MKGGRAEAPVPRSDVSFRLDQKTANFKVAKGSRPLQWSALTEEKKKDELGQKEFRFIKSITIIRAGQLRVVLRLHISVALQQKTANFNVAAGCRVMQWSALTGESKRINLHKQSFAP